MLKPVPGIISLHHFDSGTSPESRRRSIVTADVNVMEYLKPTDIQSLPKHRGREASTFYPRLVEAFLNSGEAAMQVDVARIGRKPETVRSALAKAIKSGGFQEKVKVSLLGGEVILLLR